MDSYSHLIKAYNTTRKQIKNAKSNSNDHSKFKHQFTGKLLHDTTVVHPAKSWGKFCRTSSCFLFSINMLKARKERKDGKGNWIKKTLEIYQPITQRTS